MSGVLLYEEDVNVSETKLSTPAQGSPSKQAGAEAQWEVGTVHPTPFDGHEAPCRTHFLNKTLYNPDRKVRHQKVC